MEGRVLFDLSTYMLFEESGDSEAQCFDGDFEMEHSDAETAAAEDDAQSCSYESVCEYSARLREVVDIDLRGEDCDDWSCYEDDGVVDQCRRLLGTVAEKPPAKSEDANAKMMVNERERDRQFWEACLAS